MHPEWTVSVYIKKVQDILYENLIGGKLMSKHIVSITCAAGIAHTYMAAGISGAGREEKRGDSVRVETQGPLERKTFE